MTISVEIYNPKFASMISEIEKLDSFMLTEDCTDKCETQIHRMMYFFEDVCEAIKGQSRYEHERGVNKYGTELDNALETCKNILRKTLD